MDNGKEMYQNGRMDRLDWDPSLHPLRDYQLDIHKQKQLWESSDTHFSNIEEWKKKKKENNCT